MNASKITVLLIIGLLSFACNQSDEYDILILNGTVYDGSGGSPIVTDIGIKGDKIDKFGNLASSTGKYVIDAKGMAVAPGFIDMHAHIDPIKRLPEGESTVRQGVTTSLGGPDGSSPWPFGEYLSDLDSIGVGMNVGYLIGHNTIRRNVLSLENRAPSDEELAHMISQVEQAMDEGAFGISTGLKYLPGAFSEIDEVITLSKAASESGGIYTSHLREEGLGLIDAVSEAITISEKADIPVILTHHKVIGQPMWGKSVQTLQMVDSARAIGLDIKIDQYPYTASYTSISILIPGWARAGGNDEFKRRIADPVLRDSIKAGIEFNLLTDRGGGDLSRVQFARVGWMKELEGKTLLDWANIKGIEPNTSNGAEMVIEAQLNGGASCVFHAMDEEDVRRIMKHPFTMVASDGRLVIPGDGHPHPRWYGTFPRVLGHYVREQSVLTLEEAIYKMTKLPAMSLGLNDRGELKESMMADIVIFDPETVIDLATFEEPHQYPVGIHHVIVNGKLAVKEGIFQNIRAGKVLRKQ